MLGAVLCSALHALPRLVPILALGGRDFDDPHFTGQGTKV